jgi:2-oxoglutarate/2-oxoacid ferredoxin oxidoreductase subunit alpha
VEKIADYIPLQKFDSGSDKGKLLVVGWGSTYGAIKSACIDARAKGYEVSHVQIRHIKPFPKNLGEILYNFEKVLIPEMNTGQLSKVIRDKYMIPAIPFNKIQGVPFAAGEIFEKIEELVK